MVLACRNLMNAAIKSRRGIVRRRSEATLAFAKPKRTLGMSREGHNKYATAPQALEFASANTYSSVKPVKKVEIPHTLTFR